MSFAPINDTSSTSWGGNDDSFRQTYAVYGGLRPQLNRPTDTEGFPGYAGPDILGDGSPASLLGSSSGASCGGLAPFTPMGMDAMGPANFSNVHGTLLPRQEGLTQGGLLQYPADRIRIERDHLKREIQKKNRKKKRYESSDSESETNGESSYDSDSTGSELHLRRKRSARKKNHDSSTATNQVLKSILRNGLPQNNQPQIPKSRVSTTSAIKRHLDGRESTLQHLRKCRRCRHKYLEEEEPTGIFWWLDSRDAWIIMGGIAVLTLAAVLIKRS
jgi:hypothetical protein